MQCGEEREENWERVNGNQMKYKIMICWIYSLHSTSPILCVAQCVATDDVALLFVALIMLFFLMFFFRSFVFVCRFKFLEYINFSYRCLLNHCDYWTNKKNAHAHIALLCRIHCIHCSLFANIIAFRMEWRGEEWVSPRVYFSLLHSRNSIAKSTLLYQHYI